MCNTTLPISVNLILQTLENAGHSAYAVGGCVRDILRGVTPDDYDITTSALPDEVISLFGDDAIPTGLKHGTVTVKSNGMKCEVTTYRAEGNYSDHRRPDEVCFVTDVKDDLSRRDFTMNAIALSRQGEYIDPFNGIEDIKNKIIRCVGDAETRFNEDALRMFRALRFSATLDFTIEKATLNAIVNCAPLAKFIAVERITVELQKALLGQNMLPLEHMFAYGLTDAYMSRSCEPDFSKLSAIPRDITMRLCAMCWLLENAGSINTSEFLQNIRCSNETVKLCSTGVESAKSHPTSRLQWKQLIAQIGFPAARCAAAALITEGNNYLDLLDEIENSGECFSLNTLAINGNDIKALGVSGQNVGTELKRALEYVIEHPDSNSKSELIDFIRGRTAND